LIVTGNFIAGNNLCSFRSEERIDIVNEATIPLACNNLVNLSMNPSCELYFTADQFLEDPAYKDASYDIIIRDIENDTIIPAGTLGYNYINKTLLIKVVHECSGNSCWGYAKIEDKSIPDLVCPPDVTIDCADLGNFNVTGFPVLPVGGQRDSIAPGKWLLTSFDRCSDAILTFTDVAVSNLCPPNPFSSVITRTWVVTDNSGNTSSCTQTISVNRTDINDVIFPANYDSATGPYASLEACGTWIKIPEGQDFAGNPSPETTGYPTGILCLKASVTFTDAKIPICGANSFKIVRKWRVIDHCTGTIRELNQLITVMDTTPPNLVCPDQIGNGLIANIIGGQHICGGTWNVIPPKSITDCSSTTLDIHFLLANPDGTFPIPGIYVKSSGATSVNANNTVISNLPFGRTRIRYTATDICGNSSVCFAEVNVIDNQPPTPVCDKNSIIAIGSEGMAFAGVLTFDDGSHDNCALDYLKVRRMDPAPDWATLPKNNEIKFTCDDLGKIIMVELGVWDKAGLFNSCMVEARVQDNIFPLLTVPGPATANCYDDFTSLTRFGAATATDNCSVTVTESSEDLRNECGLGIIVRTFTATDQYGNKTTKTQIITVGNNKPFTFNDIDWPDNITLNNGCVNSVDPDDLPLASRRPRYLRNTACAQLASNYEDIVFNFTGEACQKILRRWTVIDWCQKVPGFPEIGVWSFTQIIMINNTSAPTIQKGCLPADLVITQVGVCSVNVKVTAEATDDCTDSDLLKWTYTIDEGNDGSIEVTNGTGNIINRDFNYGTHKITWSVKDGCNNVRSCSNIFTVNDNKKPTPYCISEIVTVIMPSAREVTIWASDFDLGATDNCSVGSQLVASFSATNKNDISRTIRCLDLAGASSKQFTFDVYTIDASNNSDFCTVKLIVQDNGNSCGNTVNPLASISLRGNVYNESDEKVQDVVLELSSNQAEFPKSISTDVNGKFLFNELPMYKNYALVPEKLDNPLNGVSTLDLVMIQRHILGISDLNSPYKLIAADINNSAKITASDLVELRKLILGIQSQFANNKSWRFVDVAYQFPEPKHPFPFTENTNMNNLDHDVAGLDFMAIKIGDVNGSAKSNASENNELNNRSVVSLLTDNISGKKDEIVDVTINANELKNILGMQMSISFDKNLSELVEIKSNTISLNEEHLGFGQLAEGLIHFSWNNISPLDISGQLITFRFRLLQPVENKSLISLDRTHLKPELYTQESGNLSSNSIRLDSGSSTLPNSDKFELYQNVPNPFNNSTVIGFNLPET
ncbi:MAG: hypothetical protein H7X99_11640, partial [Saprospiraceae bacterium]|nr:hypothetical protein [Saprospiraceae bacterium]